MSNLKQQALPDMQSTDTGDVYTDVEFRQRGDQFWVFANITKNTGGASKKVQELLIPKSPVYSGAEDAGTTLINWMQGHGTLPESLIVPEQPQKTFFGSVIDGDGIIGSLNGDALPSVEAFGGSVLFKRVNTRGHLAVTAAALDLRNESRKITPDSICKKLANKPEIIPEALPDIKPMKASGNWEKCIFRLPDSSRQLQRTFGDFCTMVFAPRAGLGTSGSNYDFFNCMSFTPENPLEDFDVSMYRKRTQGALEAAAIIQQRFPEAEFRFV